MSGVVGDDEWDKAWAEDHLARHPRPRRDATPEELRALILQLREECYILARADAEWEVAHERLTRILMRVSRSDMAGVERQREATQKRLANMPELISTFLDRDIEAELAERPDLGNKELAESLWAHYPEYKDWKIIANRIVNIKKRLRGG